MRLKLFRHYRLAMRRLPHATWAVMLLWSSGLSVAAAPGDVAPEQAPSLPTNCLESGDGYLRAQLAGAIEAKIDWPNSGTRCQGEPKEQPTGVRLSFQRVSPDSADLLFVFGITGVREGQPAHITGVNLTVIVQGTSRIYGTLGDSRCTVDSLTQQPLPTRGSYRVEARGFCTQPAHAVRGKDAVLVGTFEFAGLVNYGGASDAPGNGAPGNGAPGNGAPGNGAAGKGAPSNAAHAAGHVTSK